jgi:hypothetical protein
MESSTSRKCQFCDLALSKGEAQYVDETTFPFYKSLPEGVNLGTYCYSCYDRIVGPSLDIYNEKMEKAKNVNVFYFSQSKESRFVRRKERHIEVSNCEDKDDAILRLAFIAVEQGQNTLLDVEITTTKTRNGGWQSSHCGARAIPAIVDEVKLQRRFPTTPN